jgi:small subunit ribosomal protein S17
MSTETNKKTLQGTVVSDAMDKTVVVEVGRFVKHPKYKKFYKISKKYHAHDEKNQYKIGDTVDINKQFYKYNTSSYARLEDFLEI